jgi:hypothetical protein
MSFYPNLRKSATGPQQFRFQTRNGMMEVLVTVAAGGCFGYRAIFLLPFRLFRRLNCLLFFYLSC